MIGFIKIVGTGPGSGGETYCAIASKMGCGVPNVLLGRSPFCACPADRPLRLFIGRPNVVDSPAKDKHGL